ncbi:hypothetical protein B0H16DRAFT_1477240 [Mycena metata]|uniref:Uncharacterized protein n=1 Tax=Mycena metata TaxID=1033252 RepID=A0AAD7MGS7_9AGAR|nr:hypothetical protein B0H16DRAFT_1477240 [Mycena metata]
MAIKAFTASTMAGSAATRLRTASMVVMGRHGGGGARWKRWQRRSLCQRQGTTARPCSRNAEQRWGILEKGSTQELSRTTSKHRRRNSPKGGGKMVQIIDSEREINLGDTECERRLKRDCTPLSLRGKVTIDIITKSVDRIKGLDVLGNHRQGLDTTGQHHPSTLQPWRDWASSLFTSECKSSKALFWYMHAELEAIPSSARSARQQDNNNLNSPGSHQPIALAVHLPWHVPSPIAESLTPFCAITFFHARVHGVFKIVPEVIVAERLSTGIFNDDDLFNATAEPFTDPDIAESATETLAWYQETYTRIRSFVFLHRLGLRSRTPPPPSSCGNFHLTASSFLNGSLLSPMLINFSSSNALMLVEAAFTINLWLVLHDSDLRSPSSFPPNQCLSSAKDLSKLLTAVLLVSLPQNSSCSLANTCVRGWAELGWAWGDWKLLVGGIRALRAFGDDSHLAQQRRRLSARGERPQLAQSQSKKSAAQSRRPEIQSRLELLLAAL